jgi:hypothetical protein
MINEYTDALTRVVVTAMEEHVPLSRPSPYTNRWWTRVLSVLRIAYGRAHRAIVKDDPLHLSWNAMREAKNTYHSAIRKEKHSHWREYITNLPHANIWTAAKYALDPTSASSSARTPDLVDTDGSVASSPEEKAAVFHAKFFPPKPDIPPPLAGPHPSPSPSPLFTVEAFH